MSKNIFVIGNSRSGTTMLSFILDRNIQVFSFHELHFFERLYIPSSNNNTIDKEKSIQLFAELLKSQRKGLFKKKIDKKLLKEAEVAIENMNSEYHPTKIFNYFLQYEIQRHGASISCEQTPRNLFYLDAISKEFEEPYFLCMLRDPRDILVSQKYKWMRRFKGAKNIPLWESFRAWVNYHPITMSLLWNKSVKKMKEEMYRKNFKVIKYEDLVENPSIEVQKICDFIGITYAEDMLNIPLKGSSSKRDSSEVGISKKNKDRWKKKLNKVEIYLCEKYTHVYMDEFGYSREKVKPNFMVLLFYFFTFPLKIFLAIILNITRNKKILYSIKKRF